MALLHLVHDPSLKIIVDFCDSVSGQVGVRDEQHIARRPQSWTWRMLQVSLHLHFEHGITRIRQARREMHSRDNTMVKRMLRAVQVVHCLRTEVGPDLRANCRHPLSRYRIVVRRHADAMRHRMGDG